MRVQLAASLFLQSVEFGDIEDVAGLHRCGIDWCGCSYSKVSRGRRGVGAWGEAQWCSGGMSCVAAIGRWRC